MMDYAVLPPEVNSGRMYAGAGSGPLIAAAAAWDRLAAELSSAAGSYRAVISELADGVWRGPASASMTAAAEPYTAWMSSTAAQALQAAGQARAAAAAYEQAFAATVPPAAVAANRTTLASLVATNFFGQNVPAIAANQAEYGEMWAQDATAMYGYAGSSAVATTLTPFPAAPQNTNSAGTGSQAAAVSQASANSTGSATQSALSTVPNALSSAQNGGAFQGLLNFLNGDTPAGGAILNFLQTNPAITTFNQLASGTTGFQSIVGGLGYGSAGFLLSAMPGVNSGIMAASTFVSATAASTASSVTALPEAVLGTTLAGSYGPGLAGGGVAAGLGQAAPVGGLSVPQSWAAAAPEIRLAATALPTATAGLDALPATMGMGGLSGMPIVGSMVNAPRNGDGGRGDARAKVSAGAPGVFEDISNRWAQSGRDAPADTLSEREQLNELRKAVTRLAKERDVLHRSATSLIRQATQP